MTQPGPVRRISAVSLPASSAVCVVLSLVLPSLPLAAHAQARPLQPTQPTFAALVTTLPSAPAPQLPAPTASATITGIVTDIDGASIEGAQITLTLGSQPVPATPRTTTSADDGSFSFSGLPPGQYTLSISALGFAPQSSSIDAIQPGESRDLPAIVLVAAATTSIQVDANQSAIAEIQVHQEEQQRVLGAIPNFYVSYVPDPVPLDPQQKFELALRTLVDPVSFVLNGVTAGLQQADNAYAWGQGARAYGKRYGAAYGTFLTGDLLGNAVLPIAFKQDPRYFYKGTGSIHSRALYAIANAVICKGDNHRWQVDYSGILGGLAAGGISNLYYPAANRAGAAITFEGAALGTGITAISNIIQEFVVRRLTPHLPRAASSNP